MNDQAEELPSPSSAASCAEDHQVRPLEHDGVTIPREGTARVPLETRQPRRQVRKARGLHLVQALRVGRLRRGVARDEPHRRQGDGGGPDLCLQVATFAKFATFSKFLRLAGSHLGKFSVFSQMD